MIDKCKERDIPYSFYSIKKKEFLNSQKNLITSIYEMAMNPFSSTYSSNIYKQTVFGRKRKSPKILIKNILFLLIKKRK